MADHSNALARIDERPAPVALESASFLDHEKIELLKRTICKGATNDEFALFMAQVQRTRLDPFTGQIHAVKRRTKNDEGEWVDTMTIQIGVAGLELIAARTGQFQGFDGPYWCGSDGVWVDVWLQAELPRAAKVGVFRSGFIKPLYAVALWDEYVATTSQGQPTKMWREKPTLMLAKCAEALALRKAFPAEMSGLYSDDEMDQAGPVIEATGNVAGANAAPPPAPNARAVPATTPQRPAPAATASPPAKPKTAAQSAIDGLHAQGDAIGINHDGLHAIAVHRFGVSSMTELSGKALYEFRKLLDDPQAAKQALANATAETVTVEAMAPLEQLAAIRARAAERLMEDTDLSWLVWFKFKVAGLDELTAAQATELSTYIELPDSELPKLIEDVRIAANNYLDSQAAQG